MHFESRVLRDIELRYLGWQRIPEGFQTVCMRVQDLLEGFSIPRLPWRC